MGDLARDGVTVPFDDTFLTQDDPWDEIVSEINQDLNADVHLPANGASRVYTYGNVRIDFPYKAYHSQEIMMSKIIKGVKLGQHCLLESPTGTGKTAALLCALLGWQRDCYKRHDNCSKIINNRAEQMGGCREWCGIFRDEDTTQVVLEKRGRTLWLIATTDELFEEPVEDSEWKQDVSPCKKTKWSIREVKIEKPLSQVCDFCLKKFVHDKSRPPRIYYCTRTHSQISQVVKQLKATAYKNVPMTILAGREPTCLNRETSDHPSHTQAQLPLQNPTNPDALSLDDECSTLRQNYYRRLHKNQNMDPDADEDPRTGQALPPICKYFRSKAKLSEKFEEFQAKGAFDLEDLEKKGLNCTLCPYYGSSALMNSSDIVFAPYNYLLNPEIRATKGIRYINSILVFDEAHNIEDICRSVFSFKVDCEYLDKRMIPMVEQLLTIATQPDSVVNRSTLIGLCEISQLFRNWSNRIKEHGNEGARLTNRPQSVKIHDEVRKDFLGSSLSSMLIEMNMTEEAISNALQYFEEDEKKEDPKELAAEEYFFDKNIKRPFQVSARIISYLKKIRQTLNYMHHEESDDGVGGLKDYSGHVTGLANPGKNSIPVSTQAASLEKLQQPGPAEQVPEFFFKFEIICLNPAVGFRALKNTAYSIIVASGTLTPLNSFASELATNFGVQLQAKHVIPEENVWTGVVKTGPSQTTLKLVKALQVDTTVQDDLGKILVEVCEAVPNGVLVFFPSYTLMGKLLERWREKVEGQTGSIFDQITVKKHFFQEESKDKQAFKLSMERYKDLVKGDGTKNGCILFAVFRGKISEGIDFADEQARAVVSIGIPFSNYGAAGISSKRSYNDMRANEKQSGKHFLNGDQWYTIQAFRAMNQGFGRCVRHCKDWGALILIDSRLASHSNGKYISGWVKKNLKAYNNFQDVKPQLEKFVKKMTQETPTGSSSKRSHITPEYEKPPQEMDSQEEDILTQIVFPTDNHGATQLMPPVRASTPLNDSDVSNVAESSSEDSFGSELELGLGQAPSPVLPEGEANGDGVKPQLEAFVMKMTQESSVASSSKRSHVSVEYEESDVSGHGDTFLHEMDSEDDTLLSQIELPSDENCNDEDDQDLVDAVEVTECSMELLTREDENSSGSSLANREQTPLEKDDDFNEEDDEELCDALEVTESTIDLISAEDGENWSEDDVCMSSAEDNRKDT